MPVMKLVEISLVERTELFLSFGCMMFVFGVCVGIVAGAHL